MSEVLSIINEIPLGKHTTTVAMKLRDVMLPTLMEYYLKVKQKKTTTKNIKSVEAIDQQLLKGVLTAHGKIPSEFLYLETGGTLIKWVIAQRRILEKRTMSWFKK